MNLNAYQDAINRGFSEREAVRIGEDAWEDDQMESQRRVRPDDRITCDICKKAEAVTGSNGYAVCSEACCYKAMEMEARK
jgi:hypothetical protein